MHFMRPRSTRPSSLQRCQNESKQPKHCHFCIVVTECRRVSQSSCPTLLSTSFSQKNSIPASNSMEDSEGELLIKQTIAKIRKNNQRPDKNAMVFHLTSNHGLTRTAASNLVDKTIETGYIYNIPSRQGPDSYYIFEWKSHEKQQNQDSFGLEGDKNHPSPDTSTDELDLDLSYNTPSIHSRATEDEAGNATPMSLSTFGTMADAIVNLNQLLHQERQISSSLRADNLEFQARIRQLEAPLEKGQQQSQQNKAPTKESVTDDKEVPSHLGTQIETLVQLIAAGILKEVNSLRTEISTNTCDKIVTKESQSGSSIVYEDTEIASDTKPIERKKNSRKNKKRRAKVKN